MQFSITDTAAMKKDLGNSFHFAPTTKAMLSGKRVKKIERLILKEEAF